MTIQLFLDFSIAIWYTILTIQRERSTTYTTIIGKFFAWATLLKPMFSILFTSPPRIAGNLSQIITGHTTTLRPAKVSHSNRPRFHFICATRRRARRITPAFIIPRFAIASCRPLATQLAFPIKTALFRVSTANFTLAIHTGFTIARVTTLLPALISTLAIHTAFGRVAAARQACLSAATYRQTILTFGGLTIILRASLVRRSP
ncbi:MAG: hypothetical protein JW725_02220 [Candidatus Babeliaceae bacterium]|nr:hypothetical protein [Candidatus Babeliaceae bacterium]